MRDRLVGLLYTAGWNMFTDSNAINQVADHLIANGVIVPPIKLGQICYEIDSYRKEIDECRVSSITQKADASLKIRITNMRYKGVYEITADKIGKTVFLAREEAEQALKERSDSNV